MVNFRAKIKPLFQAFFNLAIILVVGWIALVLGVLLPLDLYRNLSPSLQFGNQYEDIDWSRAVTVDSGTVLELELVTEAAAKPGLIERDDSDPSHEHGTLVHSDSLTFHDRPVRYSIWKNGTTVFLRIRNDTTQAVCYEADWVSKWDTQTVTARWDSVAFGSEVMPMKIEARRLSPGKLNSLMILALYHWRAPVIVDGERMVLKILDSSRDGKPGTFRDNSALMDPDGFSVRSRRSKYDFFPTDFSHVRVSVSEPSKREWKNRDLEKISELEVSLRSSAVDLSLREQPVSDTELNALLIQLPDSRRQQFLKDWRNGHFLMAALMNKFSVSSLVQMGPGEREQLEQVTENALLKLESGKTADQVLSMRSSLYSLQTDTTGYLARKRLLLGSRVPSPDLLLEVATHLWRTSDDPSWPIPFLRHAYADTRTAKQLEGILKTWYTDDYPIQIPALLAFLLNETGERGDALEILEELFQVYDERKTPEFEQDLFRESLFWPARALYAQISAEEEALEPAIDNYAKLDQQKIPSGFPYLPAYFWDWKYQMKRLSEGEAIE